MAIEKKSKISLNARIKAIKPGSSSYNYFMNTPLNELKEEDKVIKLKLEEMNMLNESIEDINVNMDLFKSREQLLSEMDGGMPGDPLCYGQFIQYNIMNEEVAPDSPSVFGNMLDRITNTFSAIGMQISDGVTYVTDKISDLERRLSSSNNVLVRWIPKIVAAAVAVLAIYYFYSQWKAQLATGAVTAGGAAGMPTMDPAMGAMPNLIPAISVNASQEIEADPNLFFLVESVFGYTRLFEAVNNPEIYKEKNKKVFEKIAGKGEKLADNIIEKAKSVSTELLNDEQFIEFSRKNNPELLDQVKKFAKMAENSPSNSMPA